MGEVYRSRDTKLKRDVAIKVLPAELARDPERLRRFRREAEVLATLNHPHIAQIYGLEESDDTCCLVLELVEGDTLADRLERGAVPVDDALGTARQIAEALEAAHGREIVHRDLKPANIKVTPDGRVKVLDFGLAKVTGAGALDPAWAGEAGHPAGGRGAGLPPDVSKSPTITTPAMTQAGVILGTAAYMSPEQAKGRAADPRSDIWAFGCVLYEMLSGKRAFDGETAVETLGAILKSEPDWRALPQTTPPAVVSMLKRCLQKDRNRRTRDIADARFQIEEAATEPVNQPASAAAPGRGRERLLWGALTLVLAGALAVLGVIYARSAAADGQEEMRLEISAPGATLDGFALSPDGRALVYQATVEGKSQLWLRPLDSETPRALAGTDNAARPFWSPDSRSVGFFAGGQLKRIDMESGLVQTLASAPLSNGGSWGEGTILFTQSSVEPLYRVPVGSGKAVPATEVNAPHLGHRFPHFLPDGRRFLFFAFGPPESQGIYVGSLDSLATTRLIDAESAPVFLPPDFVLFARQGAVLAQRVNMKTLQAIGDPVLMARQVATPQGTVASVALSAALSGAVAYRPDTGERQLRWVHRSERSIGVVAGPDPAQPTEVRLSPNGRMVALIRRVGGNDDVWLQETARDAREKFTSDPARKYGLAWSPDSSRIVYGSTRKGVIDLYERSVGGAGTDKVLFESAESKNLYDWSPSGRWIVFAIQSPRTGRDLWALPTEGEKKPIEVARTASEELNARFSPDSQWIAYQSNQSGRYEIYVQPFPGPGVRTPVSIGGGTFPRWYSERGGLWVSYLDPADRLMAVPVTPNGARVEPGTPVELFRLQRVFTYDVSHDGQRFLINEITKDPSPITILLNWKPR
jgi:Tol biopolymer transport system component